MKLGPKSRNLLEIISLLGMETIEGIFSFPSFYRFANYSSQKSFKESLKRLEGNGWIVWDDSRATGDWVAELTSSGRSLIDGDLDPESAWNEPWDGKWRLLSFDLPRHADSQRRALREWLEKLRFGGLQGSVWITPRSLGNWTEALSGFKIDPRAVVFMTGDFGGANRSERYIMKAWDYRGINDRYKTYLNYIASGVPDIISAESFTEWFQKESHLWRQAFESDPLLPYDLMPSKLKSTYHGPKALAARKRVYENWGKAILANKTQFSTSQAPSN